jgi:hypothetical protein
MDNKRENTLTVKYCIEDKGFFNLYYSKGRHNERKVNNLAIF